MGELGTVTGPPGGGVVGGLADEWVFIKPDLGPLIAYHIQILSRCYFQKVSRTFVGIPLIHSIISIKGVILGQSTFIFDGWHTLIFFKF